MRFAWTNPIKAPAAITCRKCLNERDGFSKSGSGNPTHHLCFIIVESKINTAVLTLLKAVSKQDELLFASSESEVRPFQHFHVERTSLLCYCDWELLVNTQPVAKELLQLSTYMELRISP